MERRSMVNGHVTVLRTLKQAPETRKILLTIHGHGSEIRGGGPPEALCSNNDVIHLITGCD